MVSSSGQLIGYISHYTTAMFIFRSKEVTPSECQTSADCRCCVDNGDYCMPLRLPNSSGSACCRCFPSPLLSRNDSTGIPHILEHSVLCGSRQYPVKKPYIELLKGSLYTFLNASTYPDTTCYAVASTNTKCVEDSKTFNRRVGIMN